MEFINDELLRIVFDGIESGVLVISLDGTVQLVNPKALEILNILKSPTESFIGDPLSKLIPDKDLFLNCQPNGFQHTADIHLFDGTIKTIGFSISPLPSLSSLVILFRDLGPFLSLDKRRRQAEHLAQFGKILANLGHDIKNPLAGVLAGLQYLQSTLILDEDQTDAFSSIIHEVIKIDSITRKHLSQTKRTSFQPKESNICPIFQNVIQNFKQILNKMNSNIELHQCNDELTCVIDSQDIERLLYNLIENSIEACSSACKISLLAEFLTIDEKNDRFPNCNLDIIRIAIIDDGPGLAHSIKDTVFDAFSTTKKDGTGLGLSIAKEVVLSHGGVINLTSNFLDNKKGTCVEVFLNGSKFKPCWEIQNHSSSFTESQCERCLSKKWGNGFFCWNTEFSSCPTSNTIKETCKNCEVQKSNDLSLYWSSSHQMDTHYVCRLLTRIGAN